MLGRLRRSERRRAAAEVDRRREHAKLRRSDEKLQHRVQELQERNEELDRFAHLASHDLRSPLRTIIGFAEHLQRIGPKEPGAADAAGRIHRAGHRMWTLIDTLLVFARVGRLPLASAIVDLDALAAGALEDLASEVAELDAEVVLGPLPRVRGDAAMLGQAFSNLLANALRHAGGRPPRVRVGTEAASAPGRVRLFFADSGDGLGEEDAKALFQPFRRGQNGEPGGSGLGLSIVRRVVERHGGTVSAATDSATGGARFVVELPALPG